MADRGCFLHLITAGYVMAALLGIFTSGSARADAPKLRLQAISQAAPGGCTDLPALDIQIEEEVKQLTGRVTSRSATVPNNPTLTPAEPVPIFGGYIEPLDNSWWRARLWLKAADKVQVAVRDTYYRNFDQLTAELPQDAAALILLPDWTRTASAAPQFCSTPSTSAYPEDACDPFLPPPACGVPFDCTQSNQAPRCLTAATCGVAGKPACVVKESCRVRDWRLGTGVAALVAGGVAFGVGGLLHATATEGPTPAAITSYVAGGVLLGAGTGLVTHWALHAKTTACKK